MLINRLHIIGTNLVRGFASAKAKPKRKNVAPPKPVPVKRKDTSNPLIVCKRPEFNLYASEKISENVKFGAIPLASSGWQHYRSKEDFFILKPRTEFSMNSPDENIGFDKLGMNMDIVKALHSSFGATTTTAIQKEAIPHIMARDHTLITAETGCGKTFTFLLPIIQEILANKHKIRDREMNEPLALILTPGRELALQIAKVAHKLSTDFDIKIQTILGGNTKRLMTNPRFQDVDILVGSMGAISKLVTTGIYRMNQVRHVVLDEADTLLDDSFNEKLFYFLQRFPFYRNQLNYADQTVGTQLILVAATMPTNKEELLEKIIDLSTLHEVSSTKLHRLMPHVEQYFYRMSKSTRPNFMLNLVKSDVEKQRPVIIFGNKSATSDFISIFLNDNGIKCVNLNGDMLHAIRLGQFEKFQSGEVDVLATTDVASRGLDTIRAQHVINFDFPLHIADYIHRCGRVGRINSTNGCRITNLVSSLRELNLVQKIEHTARTQSTFKNVNANITNIIKERILKEIDKRNNEMDNM